MNGLARFCFALGFCMLVSGHGQATATTVSPVTIEGDHFVRAGKPYQIIAGSIHFQRIPRAYWRDRLQKARANPECQCQISGVVNGGRLNRGVPLRGRAMP